MRCSDEASVKRTLKDWLNSMDSGYYACTLGQYEEALDWFGEGDQAFERLQRFLKDRLS